MSDVRSAPALAGADLEVRAADRPVLPEATLDVTIVVPVQTGNAEIESVVRGLGAELRRTGRTHEFVLVFDGVRGRAWSLAQAMAAEPGSVVRTLTFQHAFGESACLSAAVEIARGRVIITSPQYMQVDPVSMGPMIAALEAGADMVSPFRSPRIDPMLNRMQSALFNWVIRRLMGGGEFHDLNCYFRAMRRELLAEIAIYGDMYRFLPVIAHRQGFRVVEVPVRHLKEWGKPGFFGLGVYVRRFLDVLGVMFLTRFTHRPLRFFGSVGCLLLVPGSIMLAGLLVQKVFFNAGLYNRPLLVIGVMFTMLGVQVIGFGLVGEIIIYSQARNLRGYRIERIYE